jgi:extracellular elastinolytic metalloproteinase
MLNTELTYRTRSLVLAEEAIRRTLPEGTAAIADPHVRRTVDGAEVVHFRLVSGGIPLFLASASARVDADAERVELEGDFSELTVVDLVPETAAEQAVRVATDHLHGHGDPGACDQRHAVPRPKRRPRYPQVASFALPSRPSVFARGAFGEAVTAELTIHEGTLSWLVTLVTRDREEYLVLVGTSGTAAGHVIFCRRVSAGACTASLFLFNPGVHVRQTVTLPCDLTFYPLALRANPPASFDWIDTNATFGNNVATFFNGTRTPVAAVAGGGGSHAFQPATERDESIVNAFFFCNFMHDFFALLGFTEADGAFHEVNTTALGKPGDRLRLLITGQTIDDIARARAFKDGDDPEIVIGRFGPTGRHAALEGGVVIHEYVHCVTQRLIGGRHNANALVRRQSKALGEAWSDFFAITIQNFYRTLHGIARDYRFGSWTSNGDVRVRTASYDAHPGTFGRVGRPPFDNDTRAGEVWAAAAIAFTERLINARPAAEWQSGYERAWRYMFDSWTGCPANPTFLDARRALFAAIADSADLAAARESFQERGMGANALAGQADTFSGIRENFDPWT